MSESWPYERLRSFGAAVALNDGTERVTFAELADKVCESLRLLDAHDVQAHDTVVVEADFGPAGLAMLLALYMKNGVVVPFNGVQQLQLGEVCELVSASHVVRLGGAGRHEVRSCQRRPLHPLVAGLREKGQAGLVLVSSGSTGRPKAVLLSLDALFTKYRSLEARRAVVMAFLLFDHIGGFNTAFHTLLSGGTLVPAQSRAVADICRLIERCRVEVLPTTPTFLNMLLVARAHEKYDLSSLRLITYGTEVMPESTLRRVAAAFPGARLKQTYGLSEVGILSTGSEDSRSLWMRLGKDVQHKVVDGVLWLKTRTAMLGYLNADSPFDADGWLCTGDLVEQNGELYRIIGRRQSIINVGGLKVHPAEVENCLLQLEGVRDVTAWGKRSPVTGQIVAVKVQVDASVEDLESFRQRLKEHCREHLDDYKVPRHISFTTEPLHGPRFKKAVLRETGGALV